MMTDAAIRSKVLKQMESLEDEVRALRCLSGLLSGNEDATSIDLSELSYLIDPIIQRENNIVEEVRGMLMPAHSASI